MLRKPANILLFLLAYPPMMDYSASSSSSSFRDQYDFKSAPPIQELLTVDIASKAILDHGNAAPAASTPHSTETRFNQAERVNEVVVDFMTAVNDAQTLERDITKMRHQNANELEQSAQCLDKIIRTQVVVSSGAHGLGFVLAAAGSASLVTDSELGLRVIILSLGVLQAISQVCNKFATDNAVEARRIRGKVDEMVSAKKKTASAKHDELVRRGVDIDSIKTISAEKEE